MRFFAVVAVLLALLGAASAHPRKWKACPVNAKNNWGHPTSGHDGHKRLQTDGSIAVTLKTLAGRATAQYCPGTTYNVGVAFRTSRKFMLTTSAGTFSGIGLVCKGKRVNREVKIKAMSYKLAVPCNAKGNIVLKVTSAECENCNYKTNAVTIRMGKCKPCPKGL